MIARNKSRRAFADTTLGVWLTIAEAVFGSAAGGTAATVAAHTGEIALPTYGWAAVKHPYFRGTDKVNIYPYPMLDFLSREKTNRTYRTVVLENEYLRITFLPELGGKIHEVIDKTTGQPRERTGQGAPGVSSGHLSRGQPMFYVNHVIKPGLIGQCGAWTSGGVEWNTGPQGHTVGCMQSVAVEILPADKDGSRSVAIGETERIYGTKWTVVVTLRPGRSFIEERIRIYNPTETIRPYYFWNCTAVANTPGFRFIYPMTLGTDHGSEKFFNWPIHEGKDLSRGTNYQDASSIFAWHCDQDFFGSYDDGADRGVVSYANHHQVPGKKAWTWGQGGFGKMHQMDLTDTDGPYNEVQTGPLLTQSEVGRLDPCEAVEWKEWWYPVHGIGGFTFANKDVAVNASVDSRKLHLRMLGTKDIEKAHLSIPSPHGKGWIASGTCTLSPRQSTPLTLDLGTNAPPFRIEIWADGHGIASFDVPLELPARKPPEKGQPLQTATEFARAGWGDFLFARFPDAESKFRQALAKDPKSVSAETGMAFLNLDRDPAAATNHAANALSVDPNHGLARFALAVAETRLGNGTDALDDAWKASLDPATAVPGRALAAKHLIRRRQWDKAIAALSEAGPWQADSVCRNRLALALLHVGNRSRAGELAQANLALDPLDSFAQSVITIADADVLGTRRSDSKPSRRRKEDARPPELVLDLVAEYASLGEDQLALWVLERQYCLIVPKENWDSLVRYWGVHAVRSADTSARECSEMPFGFSDYAQSLKLNRVEPVRPWRYEDLDALSEFANPQTDGIAALYRGHLLFHLGRHAEGRDMWKRAAELGAEPVIAYRALGMAALTLDNDSDTARKYLTQAHELDRTDAIVARDLAKVLFTQADKVDSTERKKELWAEARDTLKSAFPQGKGRSDFVALLARAQSRLGEHAETAQMLDQVRVTVWEGSHEVHDLFEESHLALGKAHLEAGRAAEALAEFNRALEYPANLATGKLENAREAHIHYLRGNALVALSRKREALAAWKQAADEPESNDKQKQEARKKAKEALEKSTL